MDKYQITNQYGTIIWKGETSSFHSAWNEMFVECKYPVAERSITKEIEAGMWIEKLSLTI